MVDVVVGRWVFAVVVAGTYGVYRGKGDTVGDTEGVVGSTEGSGRGAGRVVGGTVAGMEVADRTDRGVGGRAGMWVGGKRTFGGFGGFGKAFGGGCWRKRCSGGGWEGFERMGRV